MPQQMIAIQVKIMPYVTYSCWLHEQYQCFVFIFTSPKHKFCGIFPNPNKQTCVGELYYLYLLNERFHGMRLELHKMMLFFLRHDSMWRHWAVWNLSCKISTRFCYQVFLHQMLTLKHLTLLHVCTTQQYALPFFF